MHDPAHPNDHKTMYQVITSPVVAAPAAHFVLKLLHSNRTHYVPLNGQRSASASASAAAGDGAGVSDTKEDMMEIFHTDASGSPRELKKLMGRRNYVACVPFDTNANAGGGGLGGGLGGPAATATATATATASHYAPSIASGGSGSGGSNSGGGGGLSKLSLAVDFVVQGDGAFTTPTKYGPVIVPYLELGR